ncbi:MULTISPECIES: hypothetical protein [Actinomadura]|uniref:Uncharacterized protein n=1 Tax=Actinomadura litoris TaxID=2678616 RepID=A0A7K1L4B4_9ACTN|nr:MULTISPECIES: hypothetical protein [Actinomadura]MBT2209894.1 hypothetical protein [Actinomadura sp. NEAU-AAG7]MUN39278.1 hypothetical protein [Actinomadura litoris]
MLAKLSDRALEIFAPKVTAAAGDCFTQTCGCHGTGSYAPRWIYFRNCCWTGQAGGPYTCGSCYNTGAQC